MCARKITGRKALLIAVIAGAFFLPDQVHGDGFRFSVGVKGRNGFFGVSVGKSDRNRHHHGTYRPMHHKGAVVVGRHHGRGFRSYPQRRIIPRRTWIPGHYVTRIEYVVIPGRYEQEWVPARVRHVYIGGVVTTEVVQPGYWHKRWIPPQRVPRQVKVYIPGRYH